MATNPNDDRLARARAYIAEHKDDAPDRLAAAMRDTGQRYLDEVTGLSDAELDFSPGEGQWSVRQTCLHVDHAIGRVAGLIPLLAEGTVPDLPTPKPGVLSEDPGDFEEVIGMLKTSFERAADASKSLEGTPDLAALFEHPFFGPLNCREWMAFNVMHLEVHIRQVQRIKKALRESKTGA